MAVCEPPDLVPVGEAGRLAWASQCAAGQKIVVGMRPEHLVPDPDGALRGSVLLIERLGAESYVHLSVPGLARPLVVALRGEPPREDSNWAVSPAAGHLHVFDEQGLRIDGAQPNTIKEVA